MPTGRGLRDGAVTPANKIAADITGEERGFLRKACCPIGEAAICDRVAERR